MQHPFVVRGESSKAVLGELVHQCIPKIEAARIAHWKSEEAKSAAAQGASSSMQPLSQSQFSGSMMGACLSVVSDLSIYIYIYIFTGGVAILLVIRQTLRDLRIGGSGSIVINDGTSRSSTSSSSGSTVSSSGSMVSHGTNGGSMLIKDGTVRRKFRIYA